MSDTTADLPSPLRAWIASQLDDDEPILDALELAEAIPINPDTPDVLHAPRWLLRTPARLLLAAARTATLGTLEGFPLGEVTVEHRAGLVRDAVAVNGHLHPLPLGKGREGRAFAERTRAAGALPPANDPTPDESPLQTLGSLWLQAPPEPVAAALIEHLDDAELLLGLAQTTTVAPIDAPLWLAMTTDRGILVAVSDDGRATSWDDVPVGAAFASRTTLTQVEFNLDDTLAFSGSLLGSRPLRQLVALSPLSPPERLLRVAVAHIDEQLWPEARAFLDHALRRLDLPDDLAAAPDPERAALGQRVLLRQAQVATVLEDEDAALSALIEASRLGRGEEDFLERHASLEGVEATLWWTLLTRAHEAAEHHEAAARAYAQLASERRGEGHTLNQARSLRRADQPEQALEVYGDFIARRRAAQSFALLTSPPAERDDADPERDPDLVAGCLEVGALLEQLGRLEEACGQYLELIRLAPLHPMGYERLFALAGSSPPETGFTIAQAAALLRLLRPAAAEELEERLGAPLPTAPRPITLPTEYAPMSREAFDAGILHAGERQRWSLAQKWLGGWAASEQIDTASIERHCQRIDSSTHPLLKELLTSIAHMLGLPTPRCYLSHGTTGVRVLGQDSPFILLGLQHVTEGSERFLTPAPLAFAVGSQLAHIRADHLLLTSSEFWWSFASKAVDNLVTVASLIPATGLIGRFADGLIAQLRGKVKADHLLTLLNLAQRSIQSGAVDEGAQVLMLKGRDTVHGHLPSDDLSAETLIKEQLADFARAALYTADRFGLLACDDLTAAVHAIFRLSPRAFEELPALQRYGLAHVLARRDASGALVYRELAMRLAELFTFALSDDYRRLRAAHLRAPHPPT